MEVQELKKRKLNPLVILLIVFIFGLFFLLYYKGYLSVFLNKVIEERFNEEVSLDYDFKDQVIIDSSPCIISQSLEYVYYSGDNPNWEKNNKFGLYIYAEEKDLFEIAQNLVNSNGGEWGYVLIPYSVKDYDRDKWGRVFDQLISKRLIPVIQLWNLDVKNYKKETKQAAEFLNSFLWPIRYRYISVYNEPNDDKFWFGKASPKEYAKVLDYTIKTFKDINQDFYMLNGAFNTSSSGLEDNVDAFDFMKSMNEEIPGIFDKLDGWASHPYPQPNFTGNPYDTGRKSIKAYETELDFLKNDLGVSKNLPVFITETGWAHAEGEKYNPSFLPVETVARNFSTAYEEVWLKDERVRAVMPFTVKYDPPFDHFSWVNKDKVPYLHYDVIKKLKKVSGEPPSLVTGNVNIHNCPD